MRNSKDNTSNCKLLLAEELKQYFILHLEILLIVGGFSFNIFYDIPC